VDGDVPDANRSNLDLRFLTAWRDSESMSYEVIAPGDALAVTKESERARRYCVGKDRQEDSAFICSEQEHLELTCVLRRAQSS